jgi:hypothetical protein
MVMSTLHSAITVPPMVSTVDRDRVLRIALFATWCAATLWMASHHVFWRDEVRALSIALAGEDTFAMLRGLQGEGHPALWYLLLRGGYALAGRPEVMPALAWLIGAAAMALFVWRAPFRLGTKALVLFGFYGICELVVSPRNYGIGMLILFAIAATYPRYRDRGVVVGLLTALLCNTSVTATILAAALMVFWAIELLCEEGWHWTRKHNIFLMNCGVVLIGAILCFITVYPPAHDAVMQKPPTDGLAWTILEQLSRPDRTFHALGFSVMGDGPFATSVINILLAGALVSLIRHPAAFFSALFAMLSLQLFDRFVYPGSYRHQALFLVFVLTLHWLVRQSGSYQWSSVGRRLEPLARFGNTLFSILLALQVAITLNWTSWLISGVPVSRSADLADLLRREQLTHAILVANPDFMLEPIPYYTPNPIYLLREQRFGNAVRFNINARHDLTLGEVQLDAQRLTTATGRPVVIVLRDRIEPNSRMMVTPGPSGGTFSATPEQARAFHAVTRRIARFEPALTDESYDVYLFTGPRGG